MANPVDRETDCRIMPRSLAITAAITALALVLQGCGASLTPTETGTAAGPASPALNVPPAQDAQTPAQPATEGSDAMASLKSMLPKGEQIIGTPTELYTRIARGALTCWFGASGALKSGYMYHADADPPSKGGRSEISIRVKDKSASDPRSLRAFRVVIAPGETGSVLDIENAKIPEPLATSLTADVRRWAADEEGCSAAPAATAWSADQKAPAAGKPAKAPARTTPAKKKN